MQNFSYHIHSDFSDGKNSIEEIAQKAVFLKMQQIGISDHLIVHKNVHTLASFNKSKNIFHTSFNSIEDKFNKHAENIRKVAKKYEIKILVGYETDFFTYNGWQEEFEDFLKKIDYDYLISGNHYFMSENGEDIFDIWHYDQYKNETPESETVYLKRHFKTINDAINTGLFLFLAHLDYAQAVCVYKEQNYNEQIDNIIQSLSKTNTGCEISTKGLRKYGHFYPSENILKKLIKNNIPMIISDDAHKTEEICFRFNEAENQLKALNCQNYLKKII